MPEIRVEGLRHIYSKGTPFEKVAIDHIDLSIPAGQFVALLGHTGSGKSTLVQHLNGLLPPDEGRVLYDGEDIHRSKEALRQIRFHVGLVFQYPEYQLFEETVRADIAFGPRNMGLTQEEIDEHVRLGARFAGVDEALFPLSPLELSGGQTGSTILLVTHDMSVAARMADRLLVMDRGRLVMDGSPEEVFSRPEELRELGLDIPGSTAVAMELRRRGFDLPGSICTVAQLRDAILALKGVRADA